MLCQFPGQIGSAAVGNASLLAVKPMIGHFGVEEETGGEQTAVLILRKIVFHNFIHFLGQFVALHVA